MQWRRFKFVVWCELNSQQCSTTSGRHAWFYLNASVTFVWCLQNKSESRKTSIIIIIIIIMWYKQAWTIGNIHRTFDNEIQSIKTSSKDCNSYHSFHRLVLCTVGQQPRYMPIVVRPRPYRSLAPVSRPVSRRPSRHRPPPGIPLETCACNK